MPSKRSAFTAAVEALSAPYGGAGGNRTPVRTTYSAIFLLPYPTISPAGENLLGQDIEFVTRKIQDSWILTLGFDGDNHQISLVGIFRD
jgi:hypothetical protein